jgi:hypothetical protein
MEQDSFDLHIYSDGTVVHYYHKDLKKLIDSVTGEEKTELGRYADVIGTIFGHEIKLSWGYDYGSVEIENVLAHINVGSQQALDLSEPGGIEKGYLRYQGHNLTSDYVKAPVFSILLGYLSILSKHAVKNLYQL